MVKGKKAKLNGDKEVMMSKLMLWLSLLVVIVTQGYSQKRVMPLDPITEGFYASVHISDSLFYATTEINEQEFVYKFTLVNNSWQKQLFWEKELATGGKIGNCPYFYSRKNEDLFPLDPKFPEFSTSFDEVWVTGNDSIVYLIADYDNRGKLDIYELLYQNDWESDPDPILNEELSDKEIDEHGVFLRGDSIWFSRFEDKKWVLYYSIKNSDKWDIPKKMSDSYNSAESTIYYSHQNNHEYFSMSKNGVKAIYTLEDKLKVEFFFFVKYDTLMIGNYIDYKKAEELGIIDKVDSLSILPQDQWQKVIDIKSSDPSIVRLQETLLIVNNNKNTDVLSSSKEKDDDELKVNSGLLNIQVGVFSQKYYNIHKKYPGGFIAFLKCSDVDKDYLSKFGVFAEKRGIYYRYLILGVTQAQADKIKEIFARLDVYPFPIKNITLE